MDTTPTGSDSTKTRDYRNSHRPVDDLLLALLLLKHGKIPGRLMTSEPAHYIWTTTLWMGTTFETYYPVTHRLSEHLINKGFVTSSIPYRLSSSGYTTLAGLRTEFVREARAFVAKTNARVIWDILNAPDAVHVMEHEHRGPEFSVHLEVNAQGDKVRRKDGIFSLVPAYLGNW